MIKNKNLETLGTVHTHTHTHTHTGSSLNNQGITLVALIITVIVMMILSGATVYMIVSGNGIFDRVTETKFKSNITKIQEEYNIKLSEMKLDNINFNSASLNAGEETLEYNTKPEGEAGNIYTILPSAKIYRGELDIINGELRYIGQDVKKLRWAMEVGIRADLYEIKDGVLLSSNSNLALLNADGKITIPKEVKEIGQGAFNNVVGLKEVVIPGTVETIGKQAFANNSTLEKVTIEDGVKTIGSLAFQNCTNLKEVTMTDSVTQIGSQAFYGCSELENIKLSNSITSLESYVFSLCSKLTSFTLPNSVKTINAYAFAECTNLKEITSSESLSSIDGRAFRNCSSLETINIPEKNKNFEYADGILYSKNALGTKERIVCILASKSDSTEITIEEGITAIEWSIFSSMKKLETINLPSTVQTITGVGNNLSRTLRQINVPESNEKYTSLDGSLYTKDMKELIIMLSKATTVNVPKGVEKIDTQYCFYNCENMTSLSLPSSLTYLGNQILNGCTKITTLNIGASVDIHPLVIYNTNITKVNIDKDNPNYTADDTYIYNKDGTKIIYMIDKEKKDITIPDNVTAIGDFAFHNKQLTSVVIPNSVTTIGSSFNFNNFTKIEIPSSVISLSSTAFGSCNNLTEVIIHKAKGDLSGSPFGVPNGEKAIIWKP